MRFCGACAAALTRVCAACGAPAPLDARFCGQCAAPLDEPAPPRFVAPRVYTPKHLAEKILTSKSAIEGERKQITVLFADLKGSMELLAGSDPEDARRLLDPVLELMIEAVHRYEGTVNQVMGDGIMALFGAPLAHEDHAVRACYAALQMQDAVARHSENLGRTQGITVQIRVGLHSGDVVVRSIGSDLHLDYTAVGQTTHLAGRLEQMAEAGSILISGSTLRLAEGYVEVESLGPVPVKGLSEPVAVHRLTGAGHARSRLQVAAMRGFTPFLGRESEMAVLGRALEQARGGRGQVVAVAGEPGVGKSRLFWEFIHSPPTREWLTVESSSDLHGQGRSYAAAIELLRSYFGIKTGDDAWMIHDKVTSKVLLLDTALDPLLTPLLALLDVPVEDAGWRDLTPPQRRQKTEDACRVLLLRQSRDKPLMLVVENLHWIDAETQTLLDSLVESLPTAPVLLLVNYRPEYRHGWGAKTYYVQLRLDPLAPSSADALLQTLLGRDPALQPLKDRLVEATEGNPFFLEETVRALVETGALAGERGVFRLVTELTTVQVPASIQAVIAGRIDRLSPDDKHILQSASVIGRDAPLALLEAIAELPADRLRAGLGRLQAAEFLYEGRLFPDVEYTFKHALTHGVAYASLLRERRRALHATLVGAIERLYADRLVQQVDRLARHAFVGEVWPKAVAYLRQTGARAMARSANREAVGCLEQALVALGRLPAGPAAREQAIDVHFELRGALQPLGEFDAALQHLRAAESLAEALGDELRLGRALAYMANHFWWMGDHRRAVESGQRALTLATATDDLALKVLTSFFLGQAYNSLGDYRAAIEFTERNVEALRGELTHLRFGLTGLPAVMSRTHLARARAELGRFDHELADAAVGIAESSGHAYDLIVACLTVGDVWLRRGEPHRAIPALERALGLQYSASLPVWFPTVGTTLGLAYAMAGRLAEGVSLLEQAVEQAVAMRIMYNHAFRLCCLGEAYLLAGRRDEAAHAAERGLRTAREHHERGHEAWTVRLLGDIAATRDEPDVEAAEAHYHQAAMLAEELGMRPLLARCRLELGALHRRTGRADPARVELADAVDMFRALDMRSWLSRAEAEMAKILPGAGDAR
jgi:class 3 adenylate cyclase/tetratricopeptide (TPR) repeat protein